MTTALSRRRSLLLLGLACLIPLPFCLGAFLVNVEIALRIFSPTFHPLEHVLPPGLYHAWAVLSADLSTVSTLIPLLLLVFPLAQTMRIFRRLESDPTFAQRQGPDPYPSHFGFFQVMLGLTGTLYGMYIGLDVSGVSELAGHAPTPDTIRQSLDRLLGGTATALLSSLVGLVGAFLTARPIPWIFGRVTGVKTDETRQTLTATIERLTDDLRGLSQASRTFTDCLNPENAATLLQRLDHQAAATREASAKLDGISRLLETLVQSQAVHARQLVILENLAGIAAATRDQLGQQLGQANSTLTATAQTQQQANALVQRLVETQDTRQQEVCKTLTGIADSATAQRELAQREQDAIRNALAAYLAPSRSTQP